MNRILSIILLITLVSSNSLFAKIECEIDGDGWNPPSVGPITTWTAPICNQGKLGTGLMNANSGGGSYDHGCGVILTIGYRFFSYFAGHRLVL